MIWFIILLHMPYKCLFLILLTSVFASPVLGEVPIPNRKPLEGRVEVNVRPGTDRSILMTEFWVPIAQNQIDGSVIYGDLRLMDDNRDNNEFNIGVGYRKMVETALLGEGIVGGNIWYDRRLTKRGSKFNQITAGMEWFSDVWDAKLNAYYPLNDDKTYTQSNSNGRGVGFVGNQIVVNTDQTVVEEALPGLDLELGWKVPFAEDFSDSTRIYGGVYHFEGDRADNVTGWRARVSSDITSNIQLGARFQRDDERGSQGFLEATIRFPFGRKQSYKEQGLYARLDESPERDIDIVSNESITDEGVGENLLNSATGVIQNVIHVDNTNGAGTGTAEDPFNTLAAAEAVAGANDIIYVHRGDGTTAGQTAGITVNDAGQMLIGSGVDLVFNTDRFSTSSGGNITGSAAILIAADPLGGPIITNGGGNGVDISADNVFLSGFTVDGTTGDGVSAIYNGGSTNNNITIADITANNNANSGIVVISSDVGTSLDSAYITNSTANNNGLVGTVVIAQNNAAINNVITNNLNLNMNGNQGLGFLTNTSGVISDISASQIISQNNVLQGVAVQVDNSGVIEAFDLFNSTINSNTQQGFIISADNSGEVRSA